MKYYNNILLKKFRLRFKGFTLDINKKSHLVKIKNIHLNLNNKINTQT